MNRALLENLKHWKNSTTRQPLILRGARQVGKTWLLLEFAKTAYDNTVYINFDNNEQMRNLFSFDLDISRIITGLEIYSDKKIIAENTLLIFDEIQEVPKALASLKYFNENAPEYQIVCAGSLLGIALHKDTSFPVGKVEYLDLYPLSFFEYVKAVGEERYISILEQGDFELATVYKNKYIDLLKQYYYIGGMPEVVNSFLESKDFNEVREIQKRILDTYEQDFSKHAPSDIVPRIRMLWNSIPSQLGKENKKFIYGLIREGSRAKEYEKALLWLTDCGLVHKVPRITIPKIPLKAYEDLKAFKLFILDVGLLSCMSRLELNTLLNGNDLFIEFKGALTEQYVLQQLKTKNSIETYYWTNENANAEVDFILDIENEIIPVEVKAEVNLQAKSLKQYRDKFNPKLSIRTSIADYIDEGWLINLPLWAVETIETKSKKRN